jgi:hypothetical protein
MMIEKERRSEMIQEHKRQKERSIEDIKMDISSRFLFAQLKIMQCFVFFLPLFLFLFFSFLLSLYPRLSILLLFFTLTLFYWYAPLRKHIFYKNERKPVSQKEKIATFERDRYTCQLCGIQMNNPHLDHIFPVAKNGRNSMKNYQTLCALCNQKKGSKYEFLQWSDYFFIVKRSIEEAHETRKNRICSPAYESNAKKEKQKG